MKIVKCSKSLLETYNHCSFKYFLQYVLELETVSGKAAVMGNIVHSVLEWMARLKRKGKICVHPHLLLEYSWNMYVKNYEDHGLRKFTTRGESADFKKCRNGLDIILDSVYNPYKLKVLDVENYFAIPLDGLEYKDGNGEEQTVNMRGYIDLTHEVDKSTIEIIDWKTGKRQDFYSMKEYDYEALHANIQARTYHLATYLKYPQYENVLVTIHFINDGGPITLSFNNFDISNTLTYLYNAIRIIQNDSTIFRNRSWKCKMCSFDKTKTCQTIWDDFNTIGSEYIKQKYHKLNYKGQQNIINS